jgi:uncharacterized protein
VRPFGPQKVSSRVRGWGRDRPKSRKHGVIRSRAGLRRLAVATTLFEAGSIDEAIARLHFVQMDPIRAPARAQDLILRQRVRGYRVGDLDRWYPTASVEEGILYAYGVLPLIDWELLRPPEPGRLSAVEKAIFAHVKRAGSVASGDLETHFGRRRSMNAWGGQSRVTNLALERLHRRGLLRVIGRAGGSRRYAVAPSPTINLAPLDRLRQLILLVARVLAPVPEKTLSENVARFRRLAASTPNHRGVIRTLSEEGALIRREVEGLSYLWPSGLDDGDRTDRPVRFLAPFDPLVWDRRRFEHLWGWKYRFEAYTPPAKRRRGYYAMPLLHGDSVVGWVNLVVAEGNLQVKRGFVGTEPRIPGFAAAFDDEVERVKHFLMLDPRNATADDLEAT